VAVLIPPAAPAPAPGVGNTLTFLLGARYNVGTL
jgi:hypothetical protein